MYFLPFGSRVRFAAFRDTPAVEAELNSWLSSERSWEDLDENTILSANIVSGTPLLGIFFQKSDTFVTNSVGSPQILFAGNPSSLLFIMSDYRVASSSGFLSYEPIYDSYIRRNIDPSALAPTPGNLTNVFNELNRLETEKMSVASGTLFESLVQNTRAELTKLATRNDPLDVIMPAIAAEAGERRTVVNDILSQLDTLQERTDGSVDVTNYPTKTEFYDQISRRATTGYIDGLLAAKASDTDLTNHIYDQTLHNPTYLEVGSPSNAQFAALASRVTALETALALIQSGGIVRAISTAGGLLATNQGNGTWVIDSSYLGMGLGKPQETTFYFGGPLQVSINNGGGWVAWEEVNILGIRATLGQAPTGAPVVLDILKEGVSIYTDPSNRPTFLEGQDEIVAALPNDVVVGENEEVTVDIVGVGLSIAGADLSIQMRYQYVS